MDGDFLLGILCQVHIQNTRSKTFSQTVTFERNLINLNKLQSLNNSSDFNAFVATCLAQHKNENPNIKKGSLHLFPELWTEFALESITEALDTENNEILFPNGCCSSLECPIHLYYLIVLRNVLISS